MWRKTFDPALSEFSDEPEVAPNIYKLDPQKSSQSQTYFWGKIVQKTWGAASVASGSDWKNFWKRRAVTVLTTVAASSSGEYIAAVQNGGPIYVSSNYGVTWTQASPPSGYWESIAISSNGTQIVAADVGGGIWKAS